MTIICNTCTFHNDDLMVECEMCSMSLFTATDLARVDLDNQSLAEVRRLVAKDNALSERDQLPNLLPEGFYRCPHCSIVVNIDIVNCGVFICGIYNGKQVAQHSEAAAQKLKKTSVALGDRRFHGCALQFELVDGKPVKCTGK
jgi:hypothetical protein